MATQGSNFEIIYHDLRLSTRANQVALDTSADPLEVTAFADTARTRIGGGLTDSGISVAGFFDAAYDATMFAQKGVARPVMVAATSTVGAQAYAMDSISTSYQVNAALGDPLGFNLLFQSRVPAVSGVLAENVDLTSTGTSTDLQVGAVSAGQSLYAGIWVTAFDGTSLDVIVRSDDADGMGSPTTRVTFTQATAVGSQWATPVAGAITDDWWDVSYTFVGTSATLYAFIGIL